jgi:hypothetical protein
MTRSQGGISAARSCGSAVVLSYGSAGPGVFGLLACCRIGDGPAGAVSDEA